MAIHTDVLIIGGGMSGLSAAIQALSSGSSCIIIEKSTKVGGSARLSAGMFWAPRSYEIARETIPHGNPDLQKKFIQEHEAAVQYMRDNGVGVDDKFEGIMTIGIGYPIRILDWLDTAEKQIRSFSNSKILFNSVASKLLESNGAVTGAEVFVDSVPTTIYAKSTIIATGGFQGNSQLISQHIGPGADSIFVRSNPYSTGDGYKLAQGVGAGLSRGLSTFYGHLLPSPMFKGDVRPEQFLSLAQFQSGFAILVDSNGNRFCDESFGDEVNNQIVARLPDRKCYMILDEATRQRYALGEVFPKSGRIDRLELAKSVGGRVAKADNVEQLINALDQWGVPPAALKQTLQTFNDYVTGKVDHAYPSIGKNKESHGPIIDGKGPFWTLEVQPSITFTYGGTAVDSDARALNRDGKVIPGLFVSGMDAGGFSDYRYCGGLALAHITGQWAGISASQYATKPLLSKL